MFAPFRRLRFAFLVIGTAAAALAQTGPRATPEIVARALAATPPAAKGKIEPTWDSVRAHYQTPTWWRDAKFGIMMHWGLYAVPAKASEWYGLHMYNNRDIAQWHREKFGPQDKFGYKDFIPLFTAAKFDPAEWAALFKKSGAKFVIPTAEHHDGFALWDSAINPYNAARLGPKRDLIGDLGRAVRAEDLHYGVSEHSIEHFTFIREAAAPDNDLRDPQWADFYSVAARDQPEGVEKFLSAWLAKQYELIDKYQPDMLWFDNGLNDRVFDPLKLHLAAHYYNRAAEWKKDVSISTKGGHGGGAAFLAGTITDFERMGRAPAELTDYVWQVDEPVLHRFGYTEDSPIAKAGTVIVGLVNNVSKNGALLLNISPKADGTIPDDQQQLLLGIGRWLEVNGEAIYGTRPWKQFGEGTLKLERGQRYTGKDIRFTTKGDTLYALFLAWPEGEALITSLGQNAAGAPTGKIESITLLGDGEELEFAHESGGLRVKFPAAKPCEHVFALKITGLGL